MAIQATQDFTCLAVSLLHKFIDAVVAVKACIILQVKVISFIALNTVSMVLTIKAIGNTTG